MELLTLLAGLGLVVTLFGTVGVLATVGLMVFLERPTD
jgi:hypothetical protein